MANEFKIKNGLISPNLSLTDTTNSTSSTIGGTLTVSGGGAIAQDLYVGGTLFATVSNVANLSGGVASQIPYQSAPNTTSFIPNGTAGTILTSNGTSVPTWNNTLSLAGTATSGASNQGALTVVGGVGIGENLNVGGNTVLTGDLTVNGNTTLGNAATDTVTLASQFVTGTQLKTAQADTNTLSLSAYDVDGAAYVNLVTLTASNTPILSLTSTGVGTIENMSIGSTTRSTGAFTTLAANSAVTFNAGTNSANSTTGGTLTVTGGAAVSQDLYVGGDGIFGTGVNFTAANSNIQSAGTVNSFFQLAIQNKSNGTSATSDLVAFADNGDDTSGWIDMGITSSGYNDPTYSLSGPGDGYLYVNGKTSGVGALVISTYTAKDIIFSTGGGATANELGRWKHGQGLTISPAVNNTGINTGALQITNGGAYIAGNLYVGGTINLSGVAVQQIGQITTTAAGWNLP